MKQVEDHRPRSQGTINSSICWMGLKLFMDEKNAIQKLFSKKGHKMIHPTAQQIQCDSLIKVITTVLGILPSTSEKFRQLRQIQDDCPTSL